ncbi:MAG: hypothetical protein E6J01_02670 [Chloroflexi bacterium]|nr:MAG: hypothetical protein E6J01_02670 [Chloroflexota bacterium]
MHVTPEAILSLLATLFVAAIFALMVNELVALAQGRAPLADRIRAWIQQYPRAAIALAVVIGMVLGHLVWP